MLCLLMFRLSIAVNCSILSLLLFAEFSLMSARKRKIIAFFCVTWCFFSLRSSGNTSFTSIGFEQFKMYYTSLGAVNNDMFNRWRFLLDGSLQHSGTDHLPLLHQVNEFVHAYFTYAEDQRQFGKEDYWVSPAEMLASRQGDCEDFAIAKYFSLVRMGVPSEKLRLTFVKALTQNQAHMVLAYYPSPSAQPLILDNLDPRIRPASERSDLLPVYSFNNHGVFLAKSPQRVSQPAQFLARWSELSERAVADGSAAQPAQG